jgi:hypothetical protein
MRRVAQFTHGLNAAISGAGISHNSPSTLNNIAGTQIQWMALLVGWR